MKAREVYRMFMIPENLQLHMLRVASVAKIITDNWANGEIDRQSVIRAGLFHDIAKPITFDLAKQKRYGMSDKDITDLDSLQQRLKSNYGHSEYEVAIKICEEIGFGEKVTKIVGNQGWSNIPRLLKLKAVEPLAAIYSDMRIGLNGAMSLKERLLELQKRTGKSGYEDDGDKLESFIKQYVSIDLREINEQTVDVNIPLLETMELP